MNSGSNDQGFRPIIEVNHLKFLNWGTAQETFPDSDEGRLQAKVIAVLIDKLKVWQHAGKGSYPHCMSMCPIDTVGLLMGYLGCRLAQHVAQRCVQGAWHRPNFGRWRSCMMSKTLSLMWHTSVF